SDWRHLLMVGGSARITVCPFSRTSGNLSRGDLRQEARGGMDLRRRGLTLVAALLLVGACVALGDVTLAGHAWASSPATATPIGVRPNPRPTPRPTPTPTATPRPTPTPL